MSPPFAPEDASDPFGRDTNYDLDLADVFQDATVLPALVTPLEVTRRHSGRDSGYLRSPVEPVGTSLQARDSATEGSFLQLLREPRELQTDTFNRFADWSGHQYAGSDPGDGYCDKN